MRLLLLAALAALGIAACEQPDTTVDEQVSATADQPAGATVNAEATNATAVDESVGP